MQLTFLCSCHREWVFIHPQESISKLQEAQFYGEQFMAEHNWQEAISCLGSAFEMVEIIIELKHSDSHFLSDRLFTLSVLLSAALDKTQDGNNIVLVLKQAEAKFQYLLTSNVGDDVYLKNYMSWIQKLQNEYSEKYASPMFRSMH